MVSLHHRTRLRSFVLLGMTAITPLSSAYAATQPVMPNGGSFTSGAGQIAQSGSTMTINQSSKNGVIAWNGFSVGQGGTVQFNNGTGATLNRVTGGDISVIAGRVGATGSVFLINPNGVVISPTGQIATDGSFIASTRSTTDAQFMAGGSITLSGKSSGTIQNAGSITSKTGNVALIGKDVTNSGTITSKNGVTAMVAGDDVVMQSDGSGVYVAQKAATTGNVTNSGQIKAAAENLEASNGNVYALAGNTDGIIQATGVATVNGEVSLVADNGDVSVSGAVSAQNADGSGGTITANGANSVTIAPTAKVSASASPSLDSSKASDGVKRNGGTILIGTSAKGANNLTKSMTLEDGANIHADGQNGGDGGYIETSGEAASIGNVDITASALPGTNGTTGLSGLWMTDPYDLTIDDSAATSIQNTLNAGTDVTLQTTVSGASGPGTSNADGNGDIFVNAALSTGENSARLTIDAYRNVIINNTFIVGDGGSEDDTFEKAEDKVAINYGQGGGGGSLMFGSTGVINGYTFYLQTWAGNANPAISSGNTSLYINGSPYQFSHTAGGFMCCGRSSMRLYKYSITSANYTEPHAPIPLSIPVTIDIENQSYVYGTSVYDPNEYIVKDSSGNVITGVTISITGDGANAGLTTGVGSYELDFNGLTGASVGKYSVSGYTDGTLSITPAPLTVAANTQYSVYGDTINLGNSAFTVSGLKNSDAITSVNLATSALSTSNVGSYGITASGAVGSGLGNYAISYTNGTLNITPATLSVIAGNQTSVYGSPAVVDQSDYTISGAKNGDTFSGVTLTSDVSNLTHAGDYTISPSGVQGADLSNYTVAYTNGVYTITPAVLSVSLGNQSFVYGDAINLDGSDFSASGLKNGDTLTSVSMATSATNTSNVGSYGITGVGINGVTASDYTVNYTNSTLQITPASLMISAGNQSSVYGDAVNTGTTNFTASGLKNNDTVTGVDLTTSATNTSGIGNYDIIASNAQGNNLGNYAITYTSGSYTITPAALTITGGNQSSVYGDIPVIDQNAYTTSGLKNGDNVSGVSLTSSVDKTSNVGSYDITASSAQGNGLGNYSISYVDGNYTVTPAALTIAASNQSSVYGDVVNLGHTAFTTSGLRNNDAVNAVGLTTIATNASNVGSYGISIADAQGLGLSNYSISYVGGALQITPAALNITADNQSSVYGNMVSLGNSAFSASGLKNNDTVATVGLGTTASNLSNVGTYAITAAGATGSGLSNYDISYTDGSLQITPASLIVTAGNQSFVYGDNINLGNSTFTVSGLKNSDDVTTVGLNTTATHLSNVGTYAIASSAAQGHGLDNYDISYAGGVLQITPAALMVTADNQSSVYGGMVNLGNTAFTTTGLKNDDAVNSVNLNTLATNTSNVGSYGINVSNAQGAGLSNYTINYTGASLNITPADLVISANNQTSVYGDNVVPVAASYTVSGLKNADAVTSAAVSTSVTRSSNVGSYDIAVADAQGHGLSNYTVSYVDGSYVVTPASLTIAAKDQSSVYGDAINLGNTAFTTSGLKNGDTVNTVGLNTVATQQSNIGAYGIAASGAQGSGLSNYSINYINGTIQITPAALTLTSNDQSSMYGVTPVLGNTDFSASGLKNGDTVTGATLTSAATSNSPTGKYAITISNAIGDKLGNYTIYYNNTTPGYLNVFAPAPEPNAYIDSAVLAGNVDPLATSSTPPGTPIAIASVVSDSSQADTADGQGKNEQNAQAKKNMASMNCAFVSASECNLSIDSMGRTNAIITGIQNGVIVTPSQTVYNGFQ